MEAAQSIWLPPNDASVVIYGADDLPLVPPGVPQSVLPGIPPRQARIEKYIALVGNSLLGDLSEARLVTIQNGILALVRIIKPGERPESSANRLLGKIAEALIVRRCQDAVINREWLRVARGGAYRLRSSDDCIAIGTGLKGTISGYPTKFQPHDTQRDIVWIDRNDPENYVSCLRDGKPILKPAGLQIKVSSAGRSDIVPFIVNDAFEVPLIYFDLANDFDQVVEILLNRAAKLEGKDKAQLESRIAKLLRGSAIDGEAHDILLWYRDLIVAVIEGKLKIEELARQPDISNAATLLTAQEEPEKLIIL